MKREVEHDLQKLLQVPHRLMNPDKLVAAAKADIEVRTSTYRFTGLINTSHGNLEIKVSRQCPDRTYRLMDTLIRALQARGHRCVVCGSQTYIQVREEKFEVAIREKLMRSDEIMPGNYSYDYSPTGTLVLKIGPSWKQKEWQDGKIPLESRLSAVIAYLEWKTQKEEEWRLACQKAEGARLEKERALREQQARKEQELNSFKELLLQAKRWHEAQLLRSYIAAVAQQAEDTPSPTPQWREWLIWAEQKTDWYDPQVNLPDDLLEEVDKETLSFRKKTHFF
ncbi:hypothetical protein [Pontibacter flavimaris]|uniref:hypothetical protein n=1 Tax=Pontibacter flavimaris TaxID=1797110 RepID=UPI00111546D2|nr:hypothetical protein [Pontibacter flavimaris]